MRVALVHHWLVAQRGGEHVFNALLEIFPHADVFTLVYDAEAAPASLQERRVRPSFLQRLPRAARWYPYYLPLFPRAAESLDLTDYDLVVSSDAATVKGVCVRRETTHICYCYTPMRYVWSGYETYLRFASPLARLVLPAFAERLRRWDFDAAQRVTHFIACSQTVAERIQRYYCRESAVIYPPVDTDFFVPPSNGDVGEEFFLAVSQLVPYKRVDLIVDAFNRCGLPLLVIGEGPERARLERSAKPNIRFLGSQPAVVLRAHMQSARAFVFAGEEDFGIVMAEALACGTPVVAFGRGGAAEIVEDRCTGVLFKDQSAESLIQALDEIQGLRFSRVALRAAVMRFAKKRFIREVVEATEWAVGRATISKVS